MGIIISSLIAILKHQHNRRLERRKFLMLNRFIGTMPPNLRKDIGWPDRYLEQRSKRK